MIVEIHKSGPSTAGTMRYNGDKVRAGVAEVVAEHGIGSKDLRDIARVLSDRELLSLHEAEHVSFQMSVNPGPDDAIGDEEIPSLVKELMEGLGYGGQPWAVFRHEDTGRTHWHVISVRVDSRGKKIGDFWEKRRCDRLVTRLGKKYGFTKGSPKTEPRQGEDSAAPLFRRDGGEVLGQMEACVRHSLSYRFTTGRQFTEILRRHGVQVRVGIGGDDLKPYLSFHGLDGEGKPCTGAVSGAKFSFDVQEALSRRLDECSETDLGDKKEALLKEMASALKGTPDFAAFEGEMRTRGVDIVLPGDRKDGRDDPIVIDHRSRTAYSCPELSESIVALASGKDTAEEHTGEACKEDREAVPGHTETKGTREAGTSDAAQSVLTSALSAALTLLSAGSGDGVRKEPPRKKKDTRKKRRKI